MTTCCGCDGERKNGTVVCRSAMDINTDRLANSFQVQELQTCFYSVMKKDDGAKNP